MQKNINIKKGDANKKTREWQKRYYTERIKCKEM